MEHSRSPTAQILPCGSAMIWTSMCRPAVRYRSQKTVPSPNVEGFPTHDSLTAVSPNNPVFLTHASGHASFANARAMQLSDVDGATSNPAGGDFLKDASGKPTGCFAKPPHG